MVDYRTGIPELCEFAALLRPFGIAASLAAN